MTWQGVVVGLLFSGAILTVLWFLYRPKRWETVEPNKIVLILRMNRPKMEKDWRYRQELPVIRGPGWVHTFPWERLVKYTLPEVDVDVSGVEVATGGETPEHVVVDGRVVAKIVDPVRAFNAPDHHPLREIQRTMFAAISNYMSIVPIQDVGDIKLSQMAREIRNNLLADAQRWGVVILKVYIDKIHLPDSVVRASSNVILAEGDSNAVQIRRRGESKAEVESYGRERPIQKEDYMKLQFFDRLVNMAEAGGIKALGGFEALLGLLADDTDSDIVTPEPKARRRKK